jgi:hypothetical protein
MAAQKKAPQTVEVPAIDIGTLAITLVGDSSLICHAWSSKAKEMMLGKQMGAAKQKKAPKDPHQDFLDSLYTLPDGGYGFPSVAFKSAAVTACRFVSDMKMTSIRGAMHIVGDMVRINGEPEMREDMVRIAMGTADIRYRGEFKTWSCTFSVRYNRNAITPEQIVNLFNNAGFGVGVGEWRPERDGSFGMFHVKTQGE